VSRLRLTGGAYALPAPGLRDKAYTPNDCGEQPGARLIRGQDEQKTASSAHSLSLPLLANSIVNTGCGHGFPGDISTAAKNN
jgi:hypothetical protein